MQVCFQKFIFIHSVLYVKFLLEGVFNNGWFEMKDIHFNIIVYYKTNDSRRLFDSIIPICVKQRIQTEQVA